MRIVERVTPMLAAASAVSTLACCLPLGGAALLGLGGVLGAAAQYQQWLLPLSAVLLVAGGVQTWYVRRVCQRTSKLSLVVLGFSCVIVLLVAFAPQWMAGFLTDWLS